MSSRRHVKEFRPDEALSLISADREGRLLRCPSCASDSVARIPPRSDHDAAVACRIVLSCAACGRVVAYVAPGGDA